MPEGFREGLKECSASDPDLVQGGECGVLPVPGAGCMEGAVLPVALSPWGRGLQAAEDVIPILSSPGRSRVTRSSAFIRSRGGPVTLPVGIVGAPGSVPGSMRGPSPARWRLRRLPTGTRLGCGPARSSAMPRGRQWHSRSRAVVVAGSGLAGTRSCRRFCVIRRPCRAMAGVRFRRVRRRWFDAGDCDRGRRPPLMGICQGGYMHQVLGMRITPGRPSKWRSQVSKSASCAPAVAKIMRPQLRGRACGRPRRQRERSPCPVGRRCRLG